MQGRNFMSRNTHGALDLNDDLGSTRLSGVTRFDPTLGGTGEL